MSVSVRRYSLDDYHQLCQQAGNQGRLLELIEGELSEKMPSFVPSQIAAWVITFINLYLRENPIGRVSGADGGYQLSEDTVLIPDVGYVSKARMPALPEREAPLAPDLAVEIKSPSDSIRGLRAKAELYQKHGTRLVWVVFPETQTVEVYAQGHDVETLTLDDTLSGGDVLPNFTLAVSAIFEG